MFNLVNMSIFEDRLSARCTVASQHTTFYILLAVTV